MSCEMLLVEADRCGIDVYEKLMKSTIKGLYCDNNIWINRNIETDYEKKCVLAEELGHHHTTVGDILNQNKLGNRKQEKLARNAYKKLIPLSSFVDAHLRGISNR
ncbi:ImmA/IrrE family metallo-endopeptidase [Paenibacillus alvei]|uniref:ImmA/IrrE family metallo-endopeptidase n=1 Tax=Paenibacillus alvei TaxID=44250 RepID=UPI000289C9AA|nr:ImmA/IrrE family metallo-endopeptidase [Paenibacillus alvei]EJW14664.1 hypothetical protein PAV_11c00040 [Paenibacillus alvei DSM 29]